jgi:hypothetical protein
MKLHYYLIALAPLLTVACAIDETEAPGEDPIVQPPASINAAIDDGPVGNETKVFADNKLRVLWNADDRITYFHKYTFGYQYLFKGVDGDTAGEFEMIEPTGPVTGNTLKKVYAVYPYKVDTKIDNDGVITFTLPEEQVYHINSFGRGANTMVSMTETPELKFKNVGGYLSFKLYGENISVSSIILKGNNNELLAGKCSITVSEDGIPQVTMDETNSSDRIRLYCDPPVALKSSAEEYTEFWFVVPPVEFKDGFTITVNTTEGPLVQEAPIDLTIERNMIERMAPLKVVPNTDIKINSISSNAGGYGLPVENGGVTDSLGNVFHNYAKYNEDTRTFTITLPTVTDFSDLVFNYDITEGDVLMIGGQEVESGVTHIDASSPVTLTVCREDAEQQFSLVARNTGLAVVRITTTSFTRETVEADRVYTQNSGWGQRTKIDERKWRPSETSVDSSAFVRFESSDGTVIQEYKTQIKGRGNATWGYDKKPYALKLLEKNKVLGMPKHKRWVLLANWKDRTLLRNDAAFWLSSHTQMTIKDSEGNDVNLGLPYTVRGQFVELEFNGEHRGNYYLCEQIKIDQNRVNISKWKPEDTGDVTGGFMMEIDNNYDEPNKFKSSKFNLKYMFKDPDDNLTTDAINYMKNFINTLEVKIKDAATGDYRNDFDIDAAIWFLFVNELTGNGDFYNENYSDEYKGPHSTYLYKDKEGKLTMGPVWDFDYLTFMPSHSNEWVGAYQSGYYYKSLCNDPVFRTRLIELWSLYSKNITEFETYIRSMANMICLSEVFNTTMWGYSGYQQDQNEDNEQDFATAINTMINAFYSKKSWMDGKFVDGFTTFSNK